MNENKVVVVGQKEEIHDPLTEILRSGAKRMIAQAVEAEFEAFLSDHADKMLPDGRRRVVRHGHDPVRQIQTGIGPVEVQKPKARDRDRGLASESERIRYSSAILPHWARRTKKPRRAASGALSARRFSRRFSRRPCGAARQGRAQPL